MKDTDIIKALEICNTSVEMESCVKCPYDAIVSKGFCSHEMINDAIKLINRQKAEIERLEGSLIEEITRRENAVRAYHEAIKEFAERLKERWGAVQNGEPFFPTEEIDNLVKEMVGERE